MKKTKLRKSSKSPIALCKKRIQALLRLLAIHRDGGCVMRNHPETGKCGGYTKLGNLILQFDHLNSRARNISFGELALGVTVCKRHHFYYKKQYPFEYERCAINNIGPKREKFLYKVRADKRVYKMGLSDWTLIEIALQNELNDLQKMR